jgi:hypothetical protein
MMVAADCGDHQDRIRFLRVQRAMRDIGDSEIFDDLAALQIEITDIVKLMRWLVGVCAQRLPRRRPIEHR